MRATLAHEPFSREGWLFEPKLDGVRCLVFRRAGRTELWSRNQKLLNTKYPEIAGAFQKQGTTAFVVDGEIVALENGVSSFAKLQQRMQVQNPSGELRKKVPVLFYAFDLPYIDNYDVRKVPLRYRKQLLAGALDLSKPLHLTEHRDMEGEAYFGEACRRRWEGLIAKNYESAYVSERSRDWLKLKCVAEQEFVIVGYTDPKGHRIGFGAVLIGYYERGKLKYAGKVGTGYDTLMLQRLAKRLASLETNNSALDGDALRLAGVHWVKPKLAAQIGFTEWTGDGKLRHPRFLGLRDDKDAQEVVREK